MVDDPIEAYLDRLLVALSGSPREIRRALAEAELHLYESAAALEASGLSREEARAEAVRRMGPAEVTAGPARVTLYLTPALRRRVALSLLLIGGVGGVAIGLAGVFGLIVRALWGPAAIANAFPADSYTAADCRHWQAADPTAHDCLSVMTAVHASHFLIDTLACGVIGVLVLVLYVPLRRRWSLPGRLGELFDLELLVGAAAAATVAADLPRPRDRHRAASRTTTAWDSRSAWRPRPRWPACTSRCARAAAASPPSWAPAGRRRGRSREQVRRGRRTATAGSVRRRSRCAPGRSR